MLIVDAYGERPLHAFRTSASESRNQPFRVDSGPATTTTWCVASDLSADRLESPIAFDTLSIGADIAPMLIAIPSPRAPAARSE